jgi:tRNA (mo5U34)-methyltransferase
MSESATSPATPSVGELPLWYHTLELGDDTLTPGWFDLRRVVDKLPWPDVRGKRCLDVGTYDGFYAFELERRGAREVVATDIADDRDWDLPAAGRAAAAQKLAASYGAKGRGFEIAKQALRSKAEKRISSVYELRPDTVGTFDVVVCGSLLLHLRDPVRALEAIRSVCDEWFMSVEQISLHLSTRFRRRPVAEMNMNAVPTQWWIPNAAGHRALLEVAGFEVTESFGPFSIPFGVGHTPRGRDLRGLATRIARRVLTGGDGVPHVALQGRATHA